MRIWIAFIAVVAMTIASSQLLQAAPRADGQLEIELVDARTGQPIAARMYLLNTRKRPVKVNVPNTAEFGGHFYIDGTLVLPLRRGQYTFELDAGPEYRTQSGHFEIERHADDSKRIEMERFADLVNEGWYGGDVDFARRERDLPLILKAEHLEDVETNKFAELLPANSDKSAIKIAHVPYDWNLPVWLASGEVDAIELIHPHSLRNGVVDNEDDGRPRDRSLFPGKSGNGRWSEAVYYHVLNCSFRIPPVAGSGSGMNDNPVGTNRVYAFCGEEFSRERWWKDVVAGRVFVTNGPLLRPMVEGQPPGYVFHLDGDGSLRLEIGLNLATRVPIEYLQIIKDGRVDADVRLADWKQKKGRLPPVVFDDSGWFLVRAVTNNQAMHQCASTGPYFVEKADKPRVSRASVQFFLDWIAAAEARIREMPKLEADEGESLLAEQARAREHFERLLSTANAD
jgi:hypothetical protein